jgi:hypothetical protein
MNNNIDFKGKSHIYNAISLGWDCDPAIISVNHGIRPRKNAGYKTCPFDLMVSNYEGMCQCIIDDFKCFSDIDYLILKDNFIINTKYNFIFNHESPGNKDISHTWSTINFFVENNYKNFIIRYEERINNFRNYIKDNNIFFIHKRYNRLSIELDKIIHSKYPELNYKIICITNGDKKIELGSLNWMTRNNVDINNINRCNEESLVLKNNNNCFNYDFSVDLKKFIEGNFIK